MNARFLALASLAVMTGLVFACSSKTPAVTSGGAYVQLQNAAATAVPSGVSPSCPDPGREITIATKGQDGQLKLIVDGADDAHVSCQVDGSRYNVSVSNNNGTISAQGTYTASGAKWASSDAQVQIITPSNIYKTRSGEKCSLDITQNADGKFRANINCPIVEHATLAQACAINLSGGNPSYMAFSNCTGFE